jgi:hypothetical protein
MTGATALSAHGGEEVATTTAEIVKTPAERLPFKVIFSKDGKVIAERPVGSYDGGRKLIDNLLPLLRKGENP